MPAISPGLESSLRSLDIVILFAFLEISSTGLYVPKYMFIQFKKMKIYLEMGRYHSSSKSGFFHGNKLWRSVQILLVA